MRPLAFIFCLLAMPVFADIERQQEQIDDFWAGYQILLEFQTENPEVDLSNIAPHDVDRLIQRFTADEQRLQEWRICLTNEHFTVEECLDEL